MTEPVQRGESLWIRFGSLSRLFRNDTPPPRVIVISSTLFPPLITGFPARENTTEDTTGRVTFYVSYTCTASSRSRKVSALEIYRSEDIRVEMEEAVGAGRRFGTGLLFGETVLTGEIAR